MQLRPRRVLGQRQRARLERRPLSSARAAAPPVEPDQDGVPAGLPEQDDQVAVIEPVLRALLQHLRLQRAAASVGGAHRNLARAQRTALPAHPCDGGRAGRLVIGEHARLPREVRVVGARRDASSEEQLRSHRQRRAAQVRVHLAVWRAVLAIGHASSKPRRSCAELSV